MKTINKKIALFFAASLLFISVNALYAQPPLKARERVEQIKKMKMLEVLELNEEQSDKFLPKYTQYEKNVEDAKKALFENSRELREALDKKNSSEIKAKTEEHLKLESNLMNAMIEKKKAIRTVLTEEQFAKYLLFEQKFIHELQRIIMNKKGDCDFKPERRKRK